jgi:hypothetical protein
MVAAAAADRSSSNAAQRGGSHHQSQQATASLQAAAGARQLASGHDHAGHDGLTVERRDASGSVADRAQSERVLEQVRALIAKYPTVAALKAAGGRLTTTDNGARLSTNHYDLPQGEAAPFIDGDTKLAHLIADNQGNITSVQINVRRDGFVPEWGGLWHRHDGSNRYMVHVYADRSVDQAFDH